MSSSFKVLLKEDFCDLFEQPEESVCFLRTVCFGAGADEVPVLSGDQSLWALGCHCLSSRALRELTDAVTPQLRRRRVPGFLGAAVGR